MSIHQLNNGHPSRNQLEMGWWRRLLYFPASGLDITCCRYGPMEPGLHNPHRCRSGLRCVSLQGGFEHHRLRPGEVPLRFPCLTASGLVL